MESPFYTVLFISGGGLLGYLYYKLVGCRSGACPLTASPWTSILFGIIIASIYVFEK